MPPGKSKFAVAVDQIQRGLRPCLRDQGFRVRGRTFNRESQDGLTQVVTIQMGASDPPGTTHIPGLRENLHGLFTVNLGVYVPEVARVFGGGEAGSWIQEYHCCVRSRLGKAADEERDIWWYARDVDAVVIDVARQLEAVGFPFLERFASRDKILAEWRDRSRNMGASSPPRIVMAIILAAQAKHAEARALLQQQATEAQATQPHHAKFVRDFAAKIGLGSLDG